MGEGLSVSLTGPSISILLYENIKSCNNQEGFLLGNVSENITRTVTDSDKLNEKIEKVIHLKDVFPMPNIGDFYDNEGNVDKNKLRIYLSNNKWNNVIGWYSFRRNSPKVPTLREKLIHKLLCNLFDISAENFMFCSLTSFTNAFVTTYQFNHAFFRYNYIKFESIPMHVENLGDSHQTVNKTSTNSYPEFDEIVKNLKIDLENASQIKIMSEIQNAVQNQLMKLVNLVSESEKHIFSLENDCKHLKEQLITDKLKCQSTIGDTSNNLNVSVVSNVSQDFNFSNIKHKSESSTKEENKNLSNSKIVDKSDCFRINSSKENDVFESKQSLTKIINVPIEKRLRSKTRVVYTENNSVSRTRNKTIISDPTFDIKHKPSTSGNKRKNKVEDDPFDFEDESN